ncbi:hypothetical protein BRARA_E00648 [Brassica rapa]|uniref:O-acyltransferase WSD1 C-terminal domain-containing protein n=1 Tax=Brassica campestris TaxID=3711 RepID=A0A397ZB52_BRACM|nr:hypothetical protein BRARA_E00648 [Brassica rapa]
MAREKQETLTEEPVSPVSQLFVSPCVYSIIVFTLGFKTRCNSTAIVEGINNTWIKLPRFSSKVLTTRVEDDVVVPDLDYSNIENIDEFIEDYTSHLPNNPMDVSRPLREFHVLNIKTSNAESFGIGKFHHSLGDGMSLMSLLDTKTLLVGKFGNKVQSRKVIHRIISLDDVKFVKNTMNVAGLSKYLSKKYDDENPVAGNKKQILDKPRLRGIVAVNLRPVTKIEDDPLKYVRRAKTTMDKKKISMEPLISYGIAVEAIAKRMFGHTTVTFSNVLGPNEDISFFNHPMCYIAASAMFGPHTLIIHYVSYVDKLIINLAVDTAVIPDPHLLCDDLVESLNIIKFAALEKGLHKMKI